MFAVFALIANAQAGQAKTRSSDAGHLSRIVPIGQRTILYLTSLRARFVPEEIKGGALNLIEKLLIGSFVGSTCGLDERLFTTVAAARQCGQWRREQTHPPDPHGFSSRHKSLITPRLILC